MWNEGYEPFVNRVGCVMLSDAHHEQLFPGKDRPEVTRYHASMVRENMERLGYQFPMPLHNWYTEGMAPQYPLPKLLAEDVPKHIEMMAHELYGTWLSRAELFQRKGGCRTEPLITEVAWLPGWVRYAPGEAPVQVENPLEDTFVIDIETIVKVYNNPLMAVALSRDAWYVWLHCALTNGAFILKEVKFQEQLIPVGRNKLIIGHNVSFDRSYFKEDYDEQGSGNCYLDTLSMHQATSAITNQQRGLYNWVQKHKVETGESDSEATCQSDWLGLGFVPEWVNFAAPKGLVDAYRFHVNKNVSKEVKAIRDTFVKGSLEQIIQDRESLLLYNFNDVKLTAGLYQVLFAKWRSNNPSIVTFGGMLLLSQCKLPVPLEWDRWVNETHCYSVQDQEKQGDKLKSIAAQIDEDWKNGNKDLEQDPWLYVLDWGTAEVQIKKPKPAPVIDPVTGKKKRVKTVKEEPEIKVYSRWFFDKALKKKVTVKSQLAPVLLRLTWLGKPLVFIDGYGWCIEAKKEDKGSFLYCNMLGELEKGMELLRLLEKGSFITVEHWTDINRARRERGLPWWTGAKPGWYTRIPHPDGGDKNVGSPLVKGFVKHMKSGVLDSSEAEAAHEAIETVLRNAFWVSVDKRVREEKAIVTHNSDGKDYCTILPKIETMGCATRRIVSPLWATLSNIDPKKPAIGEELKGMVRAPEGWKMVGGDFAAQELKIASIYADKMQQCWGGTPLSFTNLVGDKLLGTDAHTEMAKALGIDRHNAKIMNFQILYLCGKKGLRDALLQGVPGMTQDVAWDKATKAIELRRGVCDHGWWIGGTDSQAYNFMETLIKQDVPRTPLWHAAIPEALRPMYCGSDFKPTRCNWTIQSTGVDLLHALLIGTTYLFKQEGIEYRYVFSLHDEAWFLVRDDEEVIKKALRCLQFAHVWAWAALADRLGMYDLPVPFAWFPELCVDKCWRKEPYVSQLSPTNKVDVPPGRAIPVNETLLP